MYLYDQKIIKKYEIISEYKFNKERRLKPYSFWICSGSEKLLLYRYKMRAPMKKRLGKKTLIDLIISGKAEREGEYNKDGLDIHLSNQKIIRNYEV